MAMMGAIVGQGLSNIKDTLIMGEVKRQENFAAALANERVAGASAVKAITDKQ